MKKQLLMIFAGLILIPSMSMAEERSTIREVAAGLGRATAGAAIGCVGGAVGGGLFAKTFTRGFAGDIIGGAAGGCVVGVVAGAVSGVAISVANAAPSEESLSALEEVPQAEEIVE